MRIFSADTVTDFVRRGDIVGVRRRLELGDDVNERRSFKSTPLIEAARRGNIAMMELLLEHGADMELVDSSRLTALHSAIDEKKSAAAIFLAQRGASADKVGFLGRTPLQCAIKKNLFGVATELLANGADPMVRSESNKVARDFIHSGPSHQQFVELLEAYTNADSVTKAKNGDAILGAVQAKHTEALSALVRATISEGNPEDIMSKHRRIQSEIESTSDEEWRLSLVGILNGHDRDTLMKVMESTNALEQVKELLEAIGNSNWIKNVKLHNGWTALHLAASLGNRATVQYLLVDCGLNPLDVSWDGKLALDIALDEDADNELCWKAATASWIYDECV